MSNKSYGKGKLNWGERLPTPGSPLVLQEQIEKNKRADTGINLTIRRSSPRMVAHVVPGNPLGAIKTERYKKALKARVTLPKVGGL